MRNKARRRSVSACLTVAVMLALASGSPVNAAPKVGVHQLDCGRIDVKDMDAFADDGSYKNVSSQLVVPCYLIRHPRGDLLWDAGIGDQFSGPEGVVLLPGFVAHVPVTLASQLVRLGTSPDRIRYLAFSHEHVDHIGNANALTNATWLLNTFEHKWTVTQEGRRGAPPPLLAGATTARIHAIVGDHDVFGDGTVQIIGAPGHTPGHQVLLVKGAERRALILAGDLWHSRPNYEFGRVPRINSSRRETLRSIQKVRSLATRTGARILISHAPEDFEAVTK